MTKVKKAIIPVAGLGTRFLPATKAIPKEMFPIFDKPTIQYIVDEAIQSGIEEIIFVTSRNKQAIEDHFKRNYELEETLIVRGKHELLDKIGMNKEVKIRFVYQEEQKGLGHAVWCARKYIQKEPFAVLLGDDIVDSEKPCLKQLIEAYEMTGSSIVAVNEVPNEQTDRYGIIQPSSNHDRLFKDDENIDRLYKVNRFVEKPTMGNAPSNLAIIGRYVFDEQIFNYLENQYVGLGGEIQLTDAIQRMSEVQDVFAYRFEGKRYDVGEKIGFIRANIDFAIRNLEYREDIEVMLKESSQLIREYYPIEKVLK